MHSSSIYLGYLVRRFPLGCRDTTWKNGLGKDGTETDKTIRRNALWVAFPLASSEGLDLAEEA